MSAIADVQKCDKVAVNEFPYSFQEKYRLCLSIACGIDALRKKNNTVHIVATFRKNNTQNCDSAPKNEELRLCSKNNTEIATHNMDFVTLREKQNSEIQSFIQYNEIISSLSLTVSFSHCHGLLVYTPVGYVLSVAARLHPCGISLPGYAPVSGFCLF